MRLLGDPAGHPQIGGRRTQGGPRSPQGPPPGDVAPKKLGRGACGPVWGALLKWDSRGHPHMWSGFGGGGRSGASGGKHRGSPPPRDLVVGIGVGRSPAAADWAPEVSTAGLGADHRELGGSPRRSRRHPGLRSAGPRCAPAGPCRPPWRCRRIPEPPLRPEPGPAGTRSPRCPAGPAALPPLGIDRAAGDARPRLPRLGPLPRSGCAGRGLPAARRFPTAASSGSRPAGAAGTHQALLPRSLGRRGRGRAPAGPPFFSHPPPPRQTPSRARV